MSYVEKGRTALLYDAISIGPFGYCSSRNGCSGASFGYDLARVVSKATGAAADLLTFGTKTFVIIPIAAGEPPPLTPPLTSGIAFIGFVISASGHHLGSAIWSALCGVVVSIATALAIGLVSAALATASDDVKAATEALTSPGPGMWMLYVACGLSGFCWILGIIECCLARQHKKRVTDVEYVPVGVVPVGQQTMGYGQKDASLIANAAPMGGYTDPYAQGRTGSHITIHTS